MWRAVIALDENITISVVCHRTLGRHAPQKSKSQKFTPDFVVVCPVCCCCCCCCCRCFWFYRCSGCCCCCSWSYTIHSVKLFFFVFSALFQLGVKFFSPSVVWHGITSTINTISCFACRFPPFFFYFFPRFGETLLLFLVWHHRCVLLLLYPQDLSKSDLHQIFVFTNFIDHFDCFLEFLGSL